MVPRLSMYGVGEASKDQQDKKREDSQNGKDCCDDTADPAGLGHTFAGRIHSSFPDFLQVTVTHNPCGDAEREAEDEAEDSKDEDEDAAMWTKRGAGQWIHIGNERFEVEVARAGWDWRCTR